MQYPFSCSPDTYTAIAAALSQARLDRYLKAAGGDRNLALRLYVWNARICEAFYIPTQLAEITFRNALAEGLRQRYGNDWHEALGLTSSLPERLQRDLNRAISEERQIHGAAFNADHVVSTLSLGFWVHLTTTRPRKYVWLGAIRERFPAMPEDFPDQAIHDSAERLRRFRNRIAHHNAIFDKGPTSEYRNIQDLVGWASPDTLWLLRQLSNPARVISRRPR